MTQIISLVGFFLARLSRKTLFAALAVAALTTVGEEGSSSLLIHIVLTDAAPDRVTVHLIMSHGGEELPLAHYAEHLAWFSAVGGTPRTADRHSNAWVTHHAAGYWLSGTRADLPELVATLAGVLAPIDVPTEFAEQERAIILREYEFARASDLNERVATAMDAVLYDGNPRAASLLGTPAEIAALDLEAARALHARTHRPGNATLVVTGDTTAREVRRAMRAVDWPDQGEGPARIAPPAFVLGPPEETVLRFAETTAAPRLVWRRVARLPEPVPFDLLEAQTALLSDILYSNLPGGLAGPLRFDAAITRGFDVLIWPIDEDTIEIVFSAAPDAGMTLAELQAAFETTLSEVSRSGIPGPTHSRVLDRFDGYWPDWDDADETARWMADYVLGRVSSLREPLPERELKRLHRDLTLVTTNTLLRQLAGEGRTAVAFIGPEDSFE